MRRPPPRWRRAQRLSGGAGVTASHGFDWTEAAIERLRALAHEGLSGREIAAAFGVTRNCIIGKCSRLRISTRGKRGAKADPSASKPKPERSKPARSKRTRSKRASPQAAAASAEPPDRPVEAVIEIQEPLPQDPVAYLDLGFRHCRAIVGREDDWPRLVLSCGAPRLEGSSWCAAHRARFCAGLAPRLAVPGRRPVEARR